MLCMYGSVQVGRYTAPMSQPKGARGLVIEKVSKKTFEDTLNTGHNNKTKNSG